MSKTPLHAAALKYSIIMSEVLRLGTAKERDIPEHPRLFAPTARSDDNYPCDITLTAGMKANLQPGVVNAFVQFQLFDGPCECYGNAIHLPLAALKNIIRRLPLWSGSEHFSRLLCQESIVCLTVRK